MKLPKLTVGDRLVWRMINSRYLGDQEVVVTRLGRRWGYARPENGSRFSEVKFDLETGYEDSGQYAARARVLTLEMDVAEKRRREALEALRASGLRFEHGHGRDISTESIEAIVRILQEEA